MMDIIIRSVAIGIFLIVLNKEGMRYLNDYKWWVAMLSLQVMLAF